MEYLPFFEDRAWTAIFCLDWRIFENFFGVEALEYCDLYGFCFIPQTDTPNIMDLHPRFPGAPAKHIFAGSPFEKVRHPQHWLKVRTLWSPQYFLQSSSALSIGIGVPSCITHLPFRYFSGIMMAKRHLLSPANTLSRSSASTSSPKTLSKSSFSKPALQ